MSHSTFVTVGAGWTSGGSAIFGACATGAGVVLVGASLYMAARQLHADYQSAVNAFEERALQEAAQQRARSVGFDGLQAQARQLSLSLSVKALDDPNTAFVLGGVSRLKSRLSGFGGSGGPGGPDGLALITAQCDALLALVEAGEASAHYATYEGLLASVSALAQRRASATGVSAASKEELGIMLRDEVEALRADLRASALCAESAATGERKLAAQAQERMDELVRLGDGQPAMALQSLNMLRDRLRSEMRGAARAAHGRAESAARIREVVGDISAHAQAVLRQQELEAPRLEASALLRRLSAVVANPESDLTALEGLAEEARNLLTETERALDEMAMAQYIEDQVASVLGSMGYRVTRTTHGESGAEAEAQGDMVAILDSGIGVKLHVDQKGGLSGEMVAFSAGAAEVNAYDEERVCSLMDKVYEGLRGRNLEVREKKRKYFRGQSNSVPVVKTAVKGTPSVAAQPAAAARALEIPGSE